MRGTMIAVATLMVLVRPSAAAESLDGAELGGAIRTLVLAALPDPLVEQSFNWGHQERVAVGVKWVRKGILLKPELMKKFHHDGAWRKIAVRADHPEQTLQARVRDVRAAESGKVLFGVELSLPVNLKFEQQLWRAGTRWYSGETRARAKVHLALVCESATRFERPSGAILPDIVYRLRINEARLTYSDCVVEHTAGVGGDAAKLLGEAIHETVKQWKPALERTLLEKANAAIVKAGDTKEIRIGLSKLLDRK